MDCEMGETPSFVVVVHVSLKSLLRSFTDFSGKHRIKTFANRILILYCEERCLVKSGYLRKKFALAVILFQEDY